VEKRWIRLDNASNMFLASQNDIDTKVFRLSAEMTNIVDPVLLQAALDRVYKDYPLFHNTLRRGIFWYYLEEWEGKARVRLETKPPCSPIYHFDRRNLLFRVLYRNNSIHLEVFHALTDGTGAMWFFEDLLTEYARLRYIKEGDKAAISSKRDKADLEDSFKRYFRKKGLQLDQTNESLEEVYREKALDQAQDTDQTEEVQNKNIFRIKGNYTPDNRPRVIKVNISVQEALKLARAEGVSLTIYMTALYVLSVYQTRAEKNKDTTISVSIPINLRQFFPSVSVRNFFSTTKVAYSFKKNEEPDLTDICQNLNKQFKRQLKKEAIKNRLKKYVEFEFNPFARVIPRPLKDLILKLSNKLNNRKITVAMSNLGVIDLPEMMDTYVENVYFYTSVVRPQFCMISYGDHLNLSFTSPFIETDIYQYFVEFLAGQGLTLTVDANKVTQEELDQDDLL